MPAPYRQRPAACSQTEERLRKPVSPNTTAVPIDKMMAASIQRNERRSVRSGSFEGAFCLNKKNSAAQKKVTTTNIVSINTMVAPSPFTPHFFLHSLPFPPSLAPLNQKPFLLLIYFYAFAACLVTGFAFIKRSTICTVSISSSRPSRCTPSFI